MKSRRQKFTLLTSIVAVAMGALSLPGCTLEQVQIGQWYRLFTPKAGACPSLQWQFVFDPQRSIGGNLSRGIEQRRIANLSGTLNPDDTFEMTATEVNGPRTARITGRFNRVLTTISIQGDGAGSACNGQTFNIRYFNYYGFSGGGGGGR